MTNQEQHSGSATSYTSWQRFSIAHVLKSRATVLLFSALLLVLYFQNASDGVFITPTNASLLLRQMAVVAVVAAGVSVLIIMGEIDLSIGSSAFFAGLVAAKCQVAGWGVAPSVLAAVGSGIFVGLVHGLVITRLSVSAFVVTLGGLLLWRGVGLLWTDAAAIGPVSSEFSSLTEGRMPQVATYVIAAATVAFAMWSGYSNYSSTKRDGGTVRMTSSVGATVALFALAAGFLWVGLGSNGLPYAVLWIAAIVVLLDFALTRTKFGRRAFLIGSNQEAAMYAGINVKQSVLLGFVMMGAIWGIAGVMLISRVGTSTADAGVNLELTAIAAAVIGGVSLRGGIGTIRGALMGALLLTTIDNGMSLLGVSSYAQNVVKALILVFAVGLDGYFTRRQQLR